MTKTLFSDKFNEKIPHSAAKSDSSAKTRPIADAAAPRAGNDRSIVMITQLEIQHIFNTQFEKKSFIAAHQSGA